jgi:hypothetical protein
MGHLKRFFDPEAVAGLAMGAFDIAPSTPVFAAVTIQSGVFVNVELLGVTLLTGFDFILFAFYDAPGLSFATANNRVDHFGGE